MSFNQKALKASNLGQPVLSFSPCHYLSSEQLNVLNTRSNWKGLTQLAVHLMIMTVSGYLWGSNLNNLVIGLPALIIYGFSFASMFAPMHECVHRSAFASNSLNDGVAWFAGLLSFYNSTFYRRYHKWHHRYTQIPGKDPELGDPKPTNLTEYVIEISGITWWLGKVKTYSRISRGLVEDYPFIPETARAEVINSVRWQLAVYGLGIAISVAFQQPWFIVYWLLPLTVAQPILRFILLAEHGGCSHDNNHNTNTRTTLTLFPIRVMMWNMPFHAEHHLYQSIPFYRLPAAHEQLKAHFTHVDHGYIKVNRDFLAKLGKTAS